jgi:hypothetical protein
MDEDVPTLLARPKSSDGGLNDPEDEEIKINRVDEDLSTPPRKTSTSPPPSPATVFKVESTKKFFTDYYRDFWNYLDAREKRLSKFM